MVSENAQELPLSWLDRAVLNIVQSRFPVSHSPYLDIAKEIGHGISEDEVYRCIRSLMERGIVRRLGAVFDTKKLGFMSALVAMRVPENRIDEVGQLISSYPGVSHNYKRTHDYNLWFTLAAPSRAAMFELLEEIKQRSGITDILYLPTVRMHKIYVNFDFSPSSSETGSPGSHPPTEKDD